MTRTRYSAKRPSPLFRAMKRAHVAALKATGTPVGNVPLRYGCGELRWTVKVLRGFDATNWIEGGPEYAAALRKAAANEPLLKKYLKRK